MSGLLLTAVISANFFGFMSTGFVNIVIAASETSSGSNKEDKEEKDKEENVEKRDDLQDKISELESQIDSQRKVERKISDEIGLIDKNVEVTQLQILNSKNIMAGIDKDIQQKTENIEILTTKLEQNKILLGEYLMRLDQSSNEQNLILYENGGNWDEYFQMMDGLEKMQEEVQRIFQEVQDQKNSVELEKEVLREKRGEQYQVFLMQDEQRKSLEFEQSRKERLLTKTQQGINSLADERDELRKQLNALQSLGTAINLDDAIELAEYASAKTGVRAAFLLGVLRVESNLGQNVGGGRYKSDMSPTQHATFKKICKELGLDASDMPVSKRVCYNTKSKDGCGGWGGAMGPAQFMPSTWMGYKDRVAKITGNKPANPWNLKDAMIAMGLKLADVPGVTAGKESAERKAAAMYLAGGAWQQYSWYGDRVMYYADGFEKYMKD